MPRFTPFNKFRLVATYVICIVSLVALMWPAASLWTSYSQSQEGGPTRVAAETKGESASSSQKPDVLNKLMSEEASKPGKNSETILSSQVEATANLLVPAIAATKVDSIFTDVDGDGRADPGDTLQYTVTVSNTGAGATDASAVKFADTLDANLTLIGGSVNSSPIGFDDSFNATGNVRITINAASGVLTNDIDPDTLNNSGLTASAGATSANGGNVTMNADGSFVYNPPAGFTGTDTFTYTVTDTAGATGTGTVSFNVTGMIWFINAAAAAGGNGRLTAPFNCLVGAGCFDAVAADDPGDNIFLFSGSYTGGLTLLANQRLIGQGAGASLSTITGLTPPTGSDALPSTGGARPTVTTTVAATSAVTVGSGNTMRGFNIGNTTAVDITGTSFGTLTILEMELNGTGRLLNLTTGTLAATFDNFQSTSGAGGPGVSLTTVGGTLTVSGTTSIAGAGTQGISVSGSAVAANFGTSTTIGSTSQGILIATSTGNLSFGNTAITAGTDGVNLQNNSAGTRSFGTLSTTNGTGVGFIHSAAGGATTVSGATTITNPGGRGIDIQGSTTSISFAATNVTQSGGTGVHLQNNSGSITFGDLDISPDAAQRGLNGISNTGTLTTTSGVITSTTTGIPVEIVGVSAASRTPLAMVLESVNANGAANGIVLTSTSGTFAVNGTGTTLGSGGTIQNITNRGASFIDANGITLKNMNFTNVGTANGADPTNPNSTCGGLETGLGGNLGCNAGIHMVNLVGATFDRVIMNGGVQQGINMNNVTTFAMTNSSVLNFGNETREDGFRIKNLLGTNSIGSTTVTGNEEIQLRVVNTAGTLTALNITGSTFSTSAPPNGVDGIQFQGTGTAVMNISVSGSTMSNNAADGFFASGTDTATVNITVTGCTFQNNLNAGVNFGIVSGSNGHFNITNNLTMTNMGGNVININVGLPSTGTLQGTISGNTIGTNGVPGSGSPAGAGIRLVTNGDGNLIANVANNTIRGLTFGSGIDIIARDGGSDINTTVTGNNINTHTTLGNNGIIAVSGATATDTTFVCADIGGAGALANVIADQPPTALDELRVRNRFAGTNFRLPGYGGGGSDTAAIVAYLQARNTNAGSTTATVSTNPFTPGGGACTQPTPFAPPQELNAAVISGAGIVNLDNLTGNEPVAVVANLLFTTPWQPSVIFDKVSSTNSSAAAHSNAVAAAPNLSESKTMFFSHARTVTNRLANGQEERKAEQVESAKPKPQDGHLDEQVKQETKSPEGSQTINIGGAPGFTLPAGKSFTITFRATIDNPQPAVPTRSNQGTVSGSNFANVLTDDPDVVGTNQPTVTNVDHTTVAIASNANPSVFGQNVTFTATMTGVPARASDPPGTVQFKADGNNIGAAVAVVVGAVGDNVSTAQASISSLTVATHVITAEYSGGGSGATGYNANIGTLAGGQVVGKANTTTGLTSSQNPSVFGQPVTFTATVNVTAPGAGSPSGTINFLDGGNPIVGCQNVALQTGQAQCQPGSLSVGNHTITTTYSGDTNFNTSNGALTGQPQVVNKANTSVGLTSSQNPAPLGTNITFTATISVTAPGAGAPTGTVAFLDGATPITGCTAVAVSAGSAQCATTALTVGNHTITAQYGGDGNFNTSNGSLTGNPQVITGPPVLTPAVGLTRVQGNAATNSQIATVSDDVASPGAITVTADTVPAGMTVTNIVNTNGNITADVAALCGAVTGNNVIVLKATDGKALNSTANLTVNVTANPNPTLGNYANSTIVTGCKLILSPDAPPADNASIATVMAAGSGGFTGIITVNPTTGTVTISNNGPVGGPFTITVTVTDNCGATAQKQFTVTVVNPPTVATEFDFDGDRKADISVYRPGATASDPSFWFILRSSDNTFLPIQFGADSDVIVPGDYNGDGSTDVAVYRPSNNTWYTSTSPANNYGAFQWGTAGDIPVPGQYDADNKTDIAVFRPSDGNWYISKSTGGSEVRHWGQAGDKPIPGDVDGDGKTDLVQYRETSFNFFILKSTGGSVVQTWGTTGDKLVLADYDGDGKDDIAAYRPSNSFWYILQSSGGTRTERWGLPGDIAAPADFDNDGKADLTVYRPSDSTWYIFNSCPCVGSGRQFGISTDKPIPTAFVP